MFASVSGHSSFHLFSNGTEIRSVFSFQFSHGQPHARASVDGTKISLSILSQFIDTIFHIPLGYLKSVYRGKKFMWELVLVRLGEGESHFVGIRIVSKIS